MPIKNVCRLCLTDNDLVWIFDKQFDSSNSMTHVVYVTTGVEITTNDIISQKICEKCQQVINQMYEFRETSLRNDQYLKEQCKVFLRNMEKIPNAELTIRDEENNSLNIDNEGKISLKEDPIELKKERKLFNKIHPSSRAIFKMYRKIKLPTQCLIYDLDPQVSIKTDDVDQYFKFRGLDIQKYIKLALQSEKTPTKKTSSLHKAKSKLPKVAAASKLIRTKEGTTESTENSPSLLNINPHPELPNENTVHLDFESQCDNNYFAQNIEEQSSSNKRKCIEVDEEKEKEIKKNIVEYLELFGFNLSKSPTTSSYVANKSEPLFICRICNSVEYSAKDLKKHQSKHLWCQFCKIKLRSLENKDEHLNSMCPVKNMMNNLPDVKLQKVEFNKRARIGYPNAFDSFSSFGDSGFTNCDINVSSVELINDDSTQKSSITLETSEVIEFFSDDVGFSHLPSGLKELCQQTTQNIPTPSATRSSLVENIVHNTVSAVTPDINIKDNCALDILDTEVTNTKIEILDDIESSHPSYGVDEPPCVDTMQQTSQIVPAPNATRRSRVENNACNTVYILRPYVKIKDSCALDLLDARLTDKQIFKELLTNYNRPAKPRVEQSTQTELPTNNSICLNRIGKTAELKLLMPLLHFYNIPVVIKNGIFNVTYTCTVQQKRRKKMCLWNDLNAVDVMPSKARTRSIKFTTPKEIVNNSSTIVFNKITQSVTPTTSKFILVNASCLSPITTASYTILSSSNSNATVNSQINNPVQNSASSVTTVAETSNKDTTIANREQQFGNIRVKNVWELT